MAIYKKSSSKKSETRVIPDERDGTLPFVKTPVHGSGGAAHDGGENPSTLPGQLSVDVFQTADEIVIVAPVAGVAADDLEITVTDEVLEIKGQRDLHFQVETGDYFTQECFWGPFSRSIILPDGVDTARIAASFKHGILTVRIPKVERIKTRMVEIVESD